MANKQNVPYPEVHQGYPQPVPMYQQGYPQPTVPQVYPVPQQQQQQQQQTTTVILNQPQTQNTLLVGSVTGHRAWTTGICDCFSDMGVCCFTFFCYQYAICQLGIRTGECCLTPYFVPGSEINLRTRIRTLGGIKGSMCDDCLAIWFCPCCAACQEARELTNMGIP